MITYGHRINGIIEGDSDLDGLIPELIALYQAGRFPFDRLIFTYRLRRINESIATRQRCDRLKAVLLA